MSAVLYPDADAYDRYDGVDLLPQGAGGTQPPKFVFDSVYSRTEGSYLTTRARRHIGSDDGRLKAGSCIAAASRATSGRAGGGDAVDAAAAAASPVGDGDGDGVEAAWWTTQRFGPLRSYGGGERFQIGWSDAGELVNALARAHRNGHTLGLAAHVLAPVDEKGAIIGSPPLYSHQIAIHPGLGSSYRDWGNWHCILDPNGEHCDTLSVVAVTRADSTPTSGSDAAAFAANYRNDERSVHGERPYAKTLTQPLSLRAEVSDVRPLGSPALTWYLQVALHLERWSGDAAASSSSSIDGRDGGYTSLSTHEARNPIYFCPRQLGCVHQAIRVPSNRPSFFFYTGRMPHAGMLVGGTLHARKSMMRRSLLFDATPQQLGFASAPWSPFYSQEGSALFLWQLRTHKKMWPRMAYVPMDPVEEGLPEDAEGIESKLMENLRAAQREAESAQNEGSRRSSGSWSLPYPSAYPKLICSARGHVSHGGGDDVRPSTRCQEWSFTRLQQYTVVSIQGPPEGIDVYSGADGGSSLGSDGRRASDSEEADDGGGDWAFQHDVWSLEYTSIDRISRFTVDFGSTVPDALMNTSTSSGKSIYLWNLPHLYLYRGTPPYSPTLYTYLLYSLITLHYTLGEFHALLFLHPSQWGLVDDSLLLNLTVLIPVILFACALPLLLLLSAHVLATPESYSLKPHDATANDNHNGNGNGNDHSSQPYQPSCLEQLIGVDETSTSGSNATTTAGSMNAAASAAQRIAESKLHEAAELEATEIIETRPIDHGIDRLRSDLPAISRLILTIGSLAFLFAGWGDYKSLFFVGVLGPSTSLDMLPFVTYMLGYCVAYWTEGYAIRTGRIKPMIRAATALSFPVLGRYPVLPIAALLGATGQLMTVHSFALMKLAHAGEVHIYAYAIYKPLAALATIALNSTVIYYATAIRACRFAYLEQGKRIPILIRADRAARQHRRLILIGSFVAVCVNVAVFGRLLASLLAFAPSDDAEPSDLGTSLLAAATTTTTTTSDVPLSARMVPLPLILLDLPITSFLIPLASTLLFDQLCGSLVRSHKIERVPDGGLVNTGPVFGVHRLPARRRGVHWGLVCVGVHALPLLGWLVLSGATAVPANDYIRWKMAFTIVLSVLYVPRTIWWGLASASLSSAQADEYVLSRRSSADNGYMQLEEVEEAAGESSNDADSDDGADLENAPSALGKVDLHAYLPAKRERDHNGRTSPRLPTLEEDDTRPPAPLVRDGSPRSCWGDLCSLLLTTLAALPAAIKLHAVASLFVPHVIEMGFQPALHHAYLETVSNGGAPRDAAMSVLLYDQTLLSLLMLTHAIALRARRWPMLLTLILSPTISLCILLMYLYPRGEERYLSSSRLKVERALEAPSAATSRLPFRLPGRSALMRHACGLIGMTSLLLPYMINSPWIAQHGHFNYLDALSEGHETQYATIVWLDDLCRLGAFALSILLAFRYVPTSEVIQASLPSRLRATPLRSLGDVLPLKTWILPILLLVYATPTSAIALSLWAHLMHFGVRIAPGAAEKKAEEVKEKKEATGSEAATGAEKAAGVTASKSPPRRPAAASPQVVAAANAPAPTPASGSSRVADITPPSRGRQFSTMI